MRRSMPPASSLTAESPVPAPPPIIGSPRATCSRNRLRMPVRELSMAKIPPRSKRRSQLTGYLRGSLVDRSKGPRCRSHQLDQLPRRRVGELRIVDMQIEFGNISAAQSVANGIVEDAPGDGIVERLSRLVDGGHAEGGQQDSDGSGGGGELRRDVAANHGIFARGGSHQRDVGVVFIERSVREPRR